MDADQPDEAKADPIEVKVPERESPPQKRSGGRRRKDPGRLSQYVQTNLMEACGIDLSQPDEAKADPKIQNR